MPSSGEYRVADQLLSVSQVADVIGVNPEAVRVWIRSGLLDGIYLGGSVGYRIERKDLDRFLLSRKGAQGLAIARGNARGFARGENGDPAG